jgi:DNA-binding HxlR family transcriptional regulator
MAGKRSYHDGCGLAHALDLIGERWALLVVRELLLGPKRFTDLRDGLPGASPNVLSLRLRELAGIGVLRRRRLYPPMSASVYELTPRGLELEPVLRELGIWGVRSATLPHDAPTSVDAMVLLMRVRFDPRAAGDLCGRYELRLGEHRFRALVADGRMDLARGATERPDAVIDASPPALKAVVSGRVPLAEKVASGEVSIHGDRQAAERFFGLYARRAG